jgi:lipid II:glycine glycyltransferase (peptidoglycan interpeptide bridge formation enzyme)
MSFLMSIENNITFALITDKKVWDDFVTSFPEPTFLNSWTWGEFERESGVSFENYGVYKNDELVGVVPFKNVKAKRGKYVHVRHAPIIDWNDNEMVDAVMEFIKSHAKDNGYYFVRMSPLLTRTDENTKKVQQYGYTVSPVPAMDSVHTLKIDVTPTEDEILAQMRKNTRYSIRKSLKMGVKVRRVTDYEKDFDTFWDIFLAGVARNKWTAFSKESVYTELMTFVKDGTAALYISEYEGQAISSGIFLFYNGRSYYHHSGSLTEFRNIPSTYGMIWEALLHAKELGLKELDLWGVSPKDDKSYSWYGLSLFKRGFGGKEYHLVDAHDLVVHPFGYVTRIYEKLEARLKGHY